MCKCANGSVNSGFSQAKGLGSTMALSSPSTQHHANKLANVSKISKWMKEFLYFWFCNHIHSIHSPSSYAGGKNWSSIGFEKLWKDWAGRETLTLKISSDEFVDNELNISFGRQLCENLYTEDAEQKKKDKTHLSRWKVVMNAQWRDADADGSHHLQGGVGGCGQGACSLSPIPANPTSL